MAVQELDLDRLLTDNQLTKKNVKNHENSMVRQH